MKSRLIRRALLTALACAMGVVPSGAQLSAGMQDTLRRAQAGEFGAPRGRGGSGRWTDGGRAYLAVEPSPAGGSDIVRYDTPTGDRSVLLAAARLTPPGQATPLRFSDYAFSTDGSRILLAASGHVVNIRKMAYDYWALDIQKGTWRHLGGSTPGNLLYAKFSPDGTRVAYVRENNLFVETLDTGTVVALTSDGNANVINGTTDYVYEEEFYLGDAFDWSPDGTRVAYYQFDVTAEPRFSLINNTDTLYPVVTTFPFAKPGETNASVRVGVVRAAGGPTTWMQTPGDAKTTYLARAQWAGNSSELVMQLLNRPQNRNDILLADVETGRVRSMLRDQDEAWVDINSSNTWIERGARWLFVSERDGWRHAYAVSRTGDARLITTGAFDLLSIAGVDEEHGWLYYIASPQDAIRRYLYRSRLDGRGQPERLTPADAVGTHTYNLSPDCRWAFHGFSTFTVPPLSDIVSLPKHEVVRVLQDGVALKEKLTPILAGRTEFFTVNVDGVSIDGWLIKPRQFDPSKHYPVIVSVYGEPASTTVNDSWGGSGRMVSAALADDGYVVASFDNRGTPAPKGRAWRKVVHGALGVLASAEQAGALRALAVSHPFVDLTRVGVFGWSGGGSMTLNLLFRYPDLYRVGVAGAGVPDQLLYNSIYQERYVGLPSENPDGYKNGSPINFAEGLKGKLLIIHGTGDDNVHYQGTERLVNRLIELNKQFSFMAYPNRRHGISGIHLETLRYGFLEEHLPAGGR